MKKISFILVVVALAAMFCVSGASAKVQYVQAPTLKSVIKVSVGPVSGSEILPVITWGGDEPTIVANGMSVKTAPGSIFAQKGLSFKIVRMDNFRKQLEGMIAGDYPYLRGTMSMINQAAEVVAGTDAELVVIYQHSWSTGGDCLVVKKGINSVKDLKGKTVAIQAYGPHIDYATKILADAGLTMNDIKIVWTPDLTAADNTPVNAFYESNIDAAFMITVDGKAVTGGDDPVPGSRILMSTKTASRVISDVYAVRADYLASNKSKVSAFVHGLLLAEQELRGIMKNKTNNTGRFKEVMQASAEILLDSRDLVEDAEGMYLDCELVGFQGNTKYFGDANWPRNFDRMTKEVQNALVAAGLMTGTAPLTHAMWDYNTMRAGLVGIDDVKTPRFSATAVAKVVAKKQAMGTLADGELFSLEVNFQPNQKVFTEDMYATDFEQVVDLAATYAGAIITVEGHSDPSKHYKMQENGATDVVLSRIKQSAKNLSVTRAMAVRDSMIAYAAKKGVALDPGQFSVVGHGIAKPKHWKPQNKQEWLENMRVQFRIISVEAETEEFEMFE